MRKTRKNRKGGNGDEEIIDPSELPKVPKEDVIKVQTVEPAKGLKGKSFLTYHKNYTPGKTIDDDEIPLAVAEPAKYIGTAVGTTYKQPPEIPKKTTLGKIFGKKKQPTIDEERILSELDFDSESLKGTCIEMVRNIGDIQVLKNYSNYFNKEMVSFTESFRKELMDSGLKRAMSYYCSMRDRLLAMDPEFYTFFPNIYYTVLYKCLLHTKAGMPVTESENILTELEKIKESNRNWRNVFRNIDLAPTGILGRENTYDIILPDEGLNYLEGTLVPLPDQSPQRIQKTGGKRRKTKRDAKNKRNKKSKRQRK